MINHDKSLSILKLAILIDLKKIQKKMFQSSQNVSFDFHAKDEMFFRGNMHYFDRVRGLFRICFPYEEKPRRNWKELLQVSLL